jgi:hypothetical protein
LGLHTQVAAVVVTIIKLVTQDLAAAAVQVTVQRLVMVPLQQQTRDLAAVVVVTIIHRAVLAEAVSLC